jgi:hypothetical protein
LFSFSCDTPASNSLEESKEFVLFKNADQNSIDQQIEGLKNSIGLQEYQINYRYKNNIRGISANLAQSQVSLLEDISSDDWEVIPGEFIIVFVDPFDGEKYGTEEGNQWSMKTIEKLQDKYGINDDKILGKWGYALFGFAAELTDEQLYYLEEENIISYIEVNRRFQLGI